MATHLTLLCHGATRSMRLGGFPAAMEPLDDGGRVTAATWRVGGSRPHHVFSSPAAAASETAGLIGLSAAPEDRLRDRDMGEWTGQPLEDVLARDGAALGAWLAGPEMAAPGGESMAEARDRIGEWLADQASRGARILAVTHPMVIRAALSAALDLPLASVLRFDIAPMTATILSHNSVWRLQGLGLSGVRRTG